MIKKTVFLAFSLLLLSSCIEEKPDIRVVCELTSTGNYLIKWETFPPMEGTVKIYESNSPDSFNIAYPAREVDINKGFDNILAIRNLNRSYFKLVFDKKYSTITSERTIQMRRIYNFRDIGGYYNRDGKQIRWGKIYRSGSLAPVPPQGVFVRNYLSHDITYMNNLGVKTLLNFRTDNDNYTSPCQYQAQNAFNLPLRGYPHVIYFDKILSGEMRRNDVIIHLQDAFFFLLDNNSDYFTKMFDVLLDESNYPSVLYCSIGVDRTGLAAALILAALDVPEEIIIDDFLLSNERVNFNSLFTSADLFSDYVQETMTAFFSAHRETITYAFDRIIKEYGSLENYLEKDFNLTSKKREKLKEILLY
jgi:Protein tyrosine/serine phosphatase